MPGYEVWNLSHTGTALTALEGGERERDRERERERERGTKKEKEGRGTLSIKEHV